MKGAGEYLGRVFKKPVPHLQGDSVVRGITAAFYTFLQEQQSMHGWVMGNLSLAYNAQSRLQDMATIMCYS